VASHPPTHLGGHEAYAFRLSKALVELGNDVELLVAGDKASRFRIKGVRGIQSARLFDFYKLPVANAIPWLIKADVDIIHGHSYVFPIVVQSAIISRMKKAKFLLHLHGGIQTSNEYRDLSLILKDKFYNPTIGRLVGSLSNGIASVSEGDLEFFREMVNIPDYIPGFLLENFVDLELIDEHISNIGETFTGNAPFVMFAGRFVHEKGSHLLPIIDNLLKEKWNIEVSWNLAGDGPLLSLIESWAASDPKRIRYHGVVYGEKFFDLLVKSDVIIIPSITVEGMPTVCLEAMACNTPVVGFNLGGISEIITDGKNGLLATVNDIDKLCQNIVDIIRKPSLRTRLGTQGRRLIEKQYSVPIIVEKTLRAYSVIQKPG
jgi:glycosyltransferase involved in cell wall biosynthesis